MLAARPAVEPVALLARLAARLGRHPDDAARRRGAQRVRADPDGGTVAGGRISRSSRSGRPPATSTRRRATRSARRCERCPGWSMRSPPPSTTPSRRFRRRSIATRSGTACGRRRMRRTRVFHDFGLEHVDAARRRRARASSSTTFFDLPVDRWSSYLRIDASPAETAEVMTELFKDVVVAAVARRSLALARIRAWPSGPPHPTVSDRRGATSSIRRIGRRPDRSTHGEHPTDGDGDGEDEPLAGVAEVRPLGQLRRWDRGRDRPAVRRVRRRSGRGTPERPRPGTVGRVGRCRSGGPR